MQMCSVLAFEERQESKKKIDLLVKINYINKNILYINIFKEIRQQLHTYFNMVLYLVELFKNKKNNKKILHVFFLIKQG